MVDWIRSAERKPTAEDADEYGCVLVCHIYNGVMITGWRHVANLQVMPYWAKVPDVPEDMDDHRIAYDAMLMGDLKKRRL